jgi:2-polyprenyl-3-methyl-5-hydroxy-6-metoxy-1,4-benzoquinol methylase
MQSASANLFDEAYYQRFYFDPKTSVADPQHIERLGAFVCSYLQYLRVPVRRVLDVGCGIGLWRAIQAQ